MVIQLAPTTELPNTEDPNEIVASSNNGAGGRDAHWRFRTRGGVDIEVRGNGEVRVNGLIVFP